MTILHLTPKERRRFHPKIDEINVPAAMYSEDVVSQSSDLIVWGLLEATLLP